MISQDLDQVRGKIFLAMIVSQSTTFLVVNFEAKKLGFLTFYYVLLALASQDEIQPCSIIHHVWNIISSEFHLFSIHASS